MPCGATVQSLADLAAKLTSAAANDVRVSTLCHAAQGALSSSSTLLQLQAFARVRGGTEGRQEKDLDWELLYLALRCGHLQEAIQVLV